jgi:hypothetical protein
MRFVDAVSQLVDGAFANHKSTVVDPQALPASDFNQLIDAAIGELNARRVLDEPLPPPASALITPRATSGPIADFNQIPILDASGTGTLRRRPS